MRVGIVKRHFSDRPRLTLIKRELRPYYFVIEEMFAATWALKFIGKNISPIVLAE